MRTLVKDTTQRSLGQKMHQCRICKAKGAFDSYLVREMMQDSKEEFEYFVCGECECLQIAKEPSDLGRYYGRDYYSFAQEEFPDYQYKNPVSREDKILDVGCGSGVWLFRKALAGWGNLYGCDPFAEKELHYGDRVQVRKCSIHDIPGDASFDMVRMKDVFEHMTDPAEVLKSASALIKPGAVIVMDIPIFPNIAFDMFGAYWFQIDAPRHIFLHSKKSLAYLEKQSGLKIVKMEYDSDYSQIFRSFFYSMGIPFYEQTKELFSQYFDEAAKQDMAKTTWQCNQAGYGDHAKLYWMHQDVPESVQEEMLKYAAEVEYVDKSLKA